MSETASQTVDKIASGAHQAVDRIASAASSAVSQLGVHGDQVLEGKDQLLDRASQYVRSQPLASLGVALAAGFILSRLL
jgi:ElaB/YqjD/DUF883 family membrane-anchored ribosome-binding protein